MNDHLLDIESLITTFPVETGRAPVVDGIDLKINKGDVLALVGESGCGKSMTAMSILRLVPKPGRIEKGRILLSGKNLLKLSIPEMHHVRGKLVSMIFQEPMTSLNPVFRAGDQVIEAIRLHERLSKTDARARTLELFIQVGIPDPEQRLDTYPHQLSGGIRQRVMIAMALSTNPQLLIADEPTTALDVTIQAQILKLLGDLREQLKMTILLITHDLGVVNELAHYIAVMYAGKIVERGTRKELLGNPQHPYTQGLLGSMPVNAKHGQALMEIKGVVPSFSDWPSGCRFSTRCPHVFEPCRDQEPKVVHLTETHSVCCHLIHE